MEKERIEFLTHQLRSPRADGEWLGKKVKEEREKELRKVMSIYLSCWLPQNFTLGATFLPSHKEKLVVHLAPLGRAVYHAAHTWLTKFALLLPPRWADKHTAQRVLVPPTATQGSGTIYECEDNCTVQLIRFSLIVFSVLTPPLN